MLIVGFCSFADESWNILLKIADQVKLTKTKALRKRPTQFAFFRSVSKEVLDRQNSQYVAQIPRLTVGSILLY